MTPCSECPWRKANHGRRHAKGFYTKGNLTRLWNQIRKGNGGQSCHPTDPSHPDHGARPDSIARECPGSIILIRREFERLRDSAEGNVIGDEHVVNYLARRRKGLTRTGLLYWLVQRYKMGGVPFIGGPKLPDVVDDPDVALPSYLEG